MKITIYVYTFRKGIEFKMEKFFVKIKGKERIDKKIYKEEQINAPDFTSDYGRLISIGYVVFDFDEQPYIDIISKIIETSNLKCKKLITTRGCHFMFKTSFPKIKDNSGQFNWIGLKCDIKGVGTQQYGKENYQAIKVNGKKRKEEYLNGATTDEELDFAPVWLYHVPNKKEQIDLTKDQEGHRNEMFYR